LEWDKHLIIFSKDFFSQHPDYVSKNPKSLFFLPPIGPNPTQLIFELLENIKNSEIHRVPESIVENIKKQELTSALKINIIEDPDNWDYVYERDALTSLSGNKLRQKRRWLKKFLDKYEYDFHLISEEFIEVCRQLQIQWCDMNECMGNPDLMEEQKAIDEALDHYLKLKFRGGLLCIEEKCVGYTFGELLNPNTVVIHVEKANKFYEGAYQAINNFFLKNCCENVKFINREQDLGDPGLRQAKSSYNPHHMVKKFIIYRTE